MNSKSRKITFTVIIVMFSGFLILASLQLSFAWFFGGNTITDETITGSSLVNYYKSGTGEENDPYIIAEPQHLYNFIWLQNKGTYDNKTVYFKVSNGVEAPALDTAIEIDMSNFVGAVPPVGTKNHPFRGVFDGNGSTIKNLWVSTNPTDWERQPNISASNVFETDFTDGVGFFGRVERPKNDTSSIVKAENFILENIEVTTNIADLQNGENTPTNGTPVGFVAGYVNGAMSKIGVKNGKFNFENANISKKVKSEFSLIGETVAGTVWDDIPGAGGSGDLVIAPMGLREENENEYAPLEFGGITTSYKQVEGSIEGTAYYVHTLSTPNDLNPVPGTKLNKIFRFYPEPETALNFNSINSNPISITNDSDSRLTQLTKELINSYTDKQEKKSVMSYYNYLTDTSYRINNNNSFYGIAPAGTFNVENLTTINYGDNKTIKCPNNCIWFNPQSAGHCFISFAPTRQNTTWSASIFRLKRNANLSLSIDKELKIKLKTSNGSAVLFDIYIEKDEDIDYEYAIAQTTGVTNNLAKFIFLTLAGTDVNGGELADGGLTSALDKIEFIKNKSGITIAEAFPNSGYTPINSHLTIISINTSCVINFCRDETLNKVYYSNQIVTEKVSSNAQSEYNDSYNYPVRATQQPPET